MCSVRSCLNNWHKGNVFLQQVCFDHKAEYGYDTTWDLHSPPKHETLVKSFESKETTNVNVHFLFSICGQKSFRGALTYREVFGLQDLLSSGVHWW